MVTVVEEALLPVTYGTYPRSCLPGGYPSEQGAVLAGLKICSKQAQKKQVADGGALRGDFWAAMESYRHGATVL